MHSAADSALGYLYQAEAGLLEFVRRSKDEPALAMSIELFDDVAFEEGGAPTELLQTKHHLRAQKPLTNASDDVWRTIRVWVDSINTGTIDPTASAFSLLTTGKAPEGSAARLLRPGPDRDADTARRLLEDTAYTSASESNKTAYRVFLQLDESLRARLVEGIVVLDGAPTIADVPDVLLRELRFASEARFLEPLIERLLGWWHRRVIAHLRGADNRIVWEEVENEIDHLRDQFKSDNLPIDIGVDDVAIDQLSHDDRMFIRQLQLLAVNRPTLEVAIRDYKRAYMQRSRWLRDQLVDPSELHRYEQNLVDEWDHQRAFLQDDLNSAEDALSQAGRALYHGLQNRDLWIRPRCQEPFVSRGSYHMLADDLRVGWHPDFVARLRHLLAAATP